MAELDRKSVEEIEGITKDLSKNYAEIAKSLKDITDETKSWEDLSKRIAINKKTISDSSELISSIDKKIFATNKEIQKATDLRLFASTRLPILQNKHIDAIRAQAIAQLDLNAAIKSGSLTTTQIVDKQERLAVRQRVISNQTEFIAKLKQNEAKYGGDVLDKMRLQATELEKIKARTFGIKNLEASKVKSLIIQQGIYSSLIKPLLGDSKEFGKIMNLGSNLLKGGATAYLAILDAALDRWIQLDRTAEAFRRDTGLILPQMVYIEKAVRQINTEFAYMGITLDKAYKAAGALYGRLGTIHLVTKDMIEFSAKVAENLGLSADNVAEFESKFSEIVKSTGATTKNIILSGVALANAAGIAPKQIMEDMAKASGATVSFLAKNPMALMRAAVEARRLGTTLENISKSGRGMLNYQESMTAELEASALLNQNISFQRSRQLVWEGKVVEARAEALRQISKAGDFTKLNVYQQETLAKAAGMTVDEVVRQQNQQKALNAMKASGNPDDLLRIKRYEEMLELTKKNGAATDEAMIKEQRAMMDKMLMQAELTKLTNSITAAWISIQDALLPIANAIMPPILFTVRAIASAFKLIGALIKGILTPLDSIAKKMRLGEDGSKKMEKVLEKMSKWIDTMIPGLEFIGRIIAYTLIPLGGIISLLLTNSRLWSIITFHITKSYIMFQRFSQGIFSSVSGFKKISMTLHDIANTIRTFGTSIKNLGSVFRPIGYAINFFGRAVTWIATIFTAINNFSQGASIAARAVATLGGLINYAIIKPLQIVARVITWVVGIFSGLSTAARGLGIFARLAAFLGPILRFAGPIGWIISAVQIVIDLFSQWMDIWADDDMDIGTKILKSLVAIPNAIWNTLIQPLVDGLDWVLKKMGITFSVGDYLKEMYNDIIDLGSRIFMPFADAWIEIMNIFDGPGDIGIKIQKGVLAAAVGILKAIMAPFEWAFERLAKLWFANSPSGIGLAIVEGIKSVGSMLLDVITWPFRTAWNFLSGIFTEFGPMILTGIKTAANSIYEFLVSPFTKAWNFIKGLPLVGKIFGAVGDAAAAVAGQVKTTIETATTSVVEIKNLDALKEVVAQLTAAVMKLGGAAGSASTIVNTPATDNSAMIAKLDELIGLLKAGGIAVNLDGRKVSSGLAVAGR